MQHCAECGYQYANMARHDIPATVRTHAATYAERLAGCTADALGAHPLAATWSALEYSCHVRDMLTVQQERIGLALTQTQPTLTPMGRDTLVTERKYNAQQPATVAEGQRTVVYGWPAPAVRTLEWVGQHTVHEMVHHLLDLGRNTDAQERD